MTTFQQVVYSMARLRASALQEVLCEKIKFSVILDV